MKNLRVLISTTAVFAIFLHADYALASPLEKKSSIVLITEEEAAKPDAKPRSGMSSAEPSDGPLIEFEAPEPGSEVEKPVPIIIHFRKNTAPVDISSLEVTYLKLFSINITDRVKPFATEKGINIKSADLPSGNHKVKFGIKDTEQNLTERTMRLKIN